MRRLPLVDDQKIPSSKKVRWEAGRVVCRRNGDWDGGDVAGDGMEAQVGLARLNREGDGSAGG